MLTSQNQFDKMRFTLFT